MDKMAYWIGSSVKHRWGTRAGSRGHLLRPEAIPITSHFLQKICMAHQRILGEILTNEACSIATAVFRRCVDSASLGARDSGVGLSPGCVHTPAGHYGAGMFERAPHHATLTIDGQSADGGVHTVLTVPRFTRFC